MKNEEKNKKQIRIEKKRLKQKDIFLKELEGKFLLVRIGTPDIPASGEDILDIQTKLDDLFEKNGVNCIVFATHHAVEIDII